MVTAAGFSGSRGHAEAAEAVQNRTRKSDRLRGFGIGAQRIVVAGRRRLHVERENSSASLPCACR
jgi:hypothetical protein